MQKCAPSEVAWRWHGGTGHTSDTTECMSSLSNSRVIVNGVRFPKDNEGYSGWRIAQLLPSIPMPALESPPHSVLPHGIRVTQ